MDIPHPDPSPIQTVEKKGVSALTMLMAVILIAVLSLGTTTVVVKDAHGRLMVTTLWDKEAWVQLFTW